MKNGVLKDRKQEEELSPKDIAQDAGVSAQTIQQYLSRLKPIKEKEGQYVDPEDKNGNPTTYYGAEHVVNGKKLRYLKKESVQPFLQNCVLKDRKKEDELSASDLEKIFVTTYRRALALLNDYKTSKSDASLYVHPSGKFKETVQIVTNRGKEMGSQVRCLKANSLDVFANQNELEYRNSSKKPKLSKAF